MPNTYTQLYIHLVFAVKFRRAQIPLSRAGEVYRYMAGIINNIQNCKTIKIGEVQDHVHILCKISTNHKIADLVRDLKTATTKYINEHKIVDHNNFYWQEGYGAFSVSPTHTDALVDYISHQPEHHLSTRFLDEYRNLLERNNIKYSEEYLFTESE